MDSLTQAALGAVVGHAGMGRHIGKWAPVWGAALGTLPDLDVFISFGGAVEDFTYHRSFSHSLLVQAVVTPWFLWLALKLHPDTRQQAGAWALTLLAIFWTHSALDALTVYGTQLFWPLTEHPFAVSSVFIIDPFYTLPLVGVLVAGIFCGFSGEKAVFRSQAVLLVSGLYLLWGMAGKGLIDTGVRNYLEARAAEAGKAEEATFVSTPAPFNTLLWRIVVRYDDRYEVGYLAVWEDWESLNPVSYSDRSDLRPVMQGHWPYDRLEWFTKGFNRLAVNESGQMVLSDLRMGLEGSYVFNFGLAEQVEGQWQAQSAWRVEEPRDLSRLPLIWERLWDDSVSLSPRHLSSSGEIRNASEAAALR